MKRYVINGKFLTQRVTGVQRYAREIVEELDKIAKPGTIELAVPNSVADVPDYKNINVVKSGNLDGNLWEQVCFPMYAIKHKAVPINLCNTSPLIYPGIVCIHDVKIKARPWDFSKTFLMWYKLLFKNATSRARAIITVSEFSRDEIVKYYKISKNKIYVVPNAWQHYERVAYDNNALNKYGLEENKYYFAMSSLEPNKNFKWIAETANKNKDDVFAIAGSINEKIFKDGLGFDVPDNMKLLGYITDEEAKTLMRDCKAFLFPSFYEGFGIPPLEAVSAGAKQVVVSDTEVMHEIFGDSVLYIDNQMANNLFNAFTDMNEQSRNRILGMFSWKKSASKLKNVFMEEDNEQI